MFVTWPILVFLGFGVFVVGSVVGSFLNVCIYRIPWQKSVIWPSSRCPRCLGTIAATDNVPIVGWLALRGECRTCGLPISKRYPLIEALVGLLFVGLYVTDVLCAARGDYGQIPTASLATFAYHALLTALLVAATFIDYDLYIIPDQVTVTGMVLGLLIGTMSPDIRPLPGTASSYGGGFWVGIVGLLVGAGLTAGVRTFASALLRREAMGFGDVTLMAMIGSFLGWQAAVLTFFLAPFFGLAHALFKLTTYLQKRLRGGQLSSADREIPFGPYLSMAAVALLLSWNWLWPYWAGDLFEMYRTVFWLMLGVKVGPPR
ncbi:MAG: prepilin peptidase [Paludisphaera borealis]|uniref:prepilin peptidase n=1 Tax=Paludisphaera borealis TaxID=1387353 RepID=UPI0028430EFB|nr:prepilin peptidase [Paludisphaera borealis]MDR3619183.1 prepilin peptidase [Paludisphaera borealis]